MGMTAAEKKAFGKGFQAGADSVEEGLPGWFGTFADMMTLLFAFFVLLAAISTMDPVKLQEMANSQGKSLGSKIKASGKASDEGEFEPIENLAAMKDAMEETIEQMKKENPANNHKLFKPTNPFFPILHRFHTRFSSDFLSKLTNMQ